MGSILDVDVNLPNGGHPLGFSEFESLENFMLRNDVTPCGIYTDTYYFDIFFYMYI